MSRKELSCLRSAPEAPSALYAPRGLFRKGDKMKKIAFLLIVMLFMVISCKTGPLKDIRLGKNFSIYAGDKILVHKAPSKDAETFYIKTPQAFLVEDVVCEDGVGKLSCYSDLMIANDFPDIVKVAYYKVSFELGGEGYINAKYFYPKLAKYIIHEDTAKRMGTTPSDLSKRARDQYASDKLKVKKVFEIVENGIRQFKEDTKKAMDEQHWPEEENIRIRSHEVWIGMNIYQLLLSQYNPEKRELSETAEGKFETWHYSDTNTRYYLKNDILIKSKTTLDPDAPTRTKEEIMEARIRRILRIDEAIREALGLDE